ncbi:MAG TPA: hypothetical protein VFI25_10815 [Planctomycetota bacterium]|jgi:hypothetical protein|nr:hypothetical protein [Planctomycetota bacterium]
MHSQEFFAFFLLAIVVVVMTAIRAAQRTRLAKLRHDLYVRMLESGKVTKEEMAEMLHGIGGDSRGRRTGEERERVGGFFGFLVGVGWIGVMVGIGLGIAGAVTGGTDQTGFFIAAAIVGTASLGLVGLPIGLRELAGRGTRPQKTPG